MKRHELTDEQWELVEPLIPRSTARTGRPAKDRRRLLNGIFWILCHRRSLARPARALWPVADRVRLLPQLAQERRLRSIIEALQVKLDKAGYIDWDLWCVDGASVRAARAAAGAEKKSRATPRRTRRPRVGPQQRRVWIEVPRCF